MHESVGRTWHLKIFYCLNSLGTSWDAKNILKIFLDNKKFWGAKSGPLTHASAVKYVNMYILLGTEIRYNKCQIRR